MARLQILELPTVHIGDAMETPFVLVIDQCRFESLDGYGTANASWQQLGAQIGARGCIVTNETIDIPANQITVENSEQP